MYFLAIAGALLYIPTIADADWSLRDWVRWLFHWRAPSPEESALAPAVPASPPLSDLLRVLHSRSWAKRLAALDALALSRDTSPPVIAGLIHATQDRHRELSDRAFQALADLCRTGHTAEVMTGFVHELAQRPEPQLVLSDYTFKVLTPEEEHRAQLAFRGQP